MSIRGVLFLYIIGSPPLDASRKKLDTCREAVDLIYHHDEQLFPNIVGKENTCLPQLEKRLLKFSASSHCDGVIYVTLYEHENRTIARVLESGCFTGKLFVVRYEGRLPDFSDRSPVHLTVNGCLALFRVRKGKGERRWAPPS